MRRLFQNTRQGKEDQHGRPAVRRDDNGRDCRGYEPRCNEGNYALPGLLRGAREEDLAFAEGRGPDPATKDNATSISGAEEDALQ